MDERLTNGPGGASSAIDAIGRTPLVEDEATTRLTEMHGAFRADQFEHAGNHRAHYFGTAPEIWTQCDGTLTAFCDFAGSGGTLAGGDGRDYRLRFRPEISKHRSLVAISQTVYSSSGNALGGTR
jgi:hypothetical protein